MKKLILLISVAIFAQNAVAVNNLEAKRLIEIAQKKLALNNVQYNLDWKTFDTTGKSKTKTISISFARFNQERRVMIEFVAPENVSGTKILTTDYLNKKGIVEIYMPSTGKVQKIRANRRTIKFSGSEIPINQFSSVLGVDFNYSFLEEELLDGVKCHKIKVEAADSKGYIVAFVSVEQEQLLRLGRYNFQNEILSMTELSEFIVVDRSNSKFYPGVVHMKNFTTGKSSSLKVRDMKYLTNLDIEDFQLTPAAS